MENSISKILGENIIRFLTIYEMTQSDLAKRMNVSQATVSDWMNGKKFPRSDKLDFLCNVLHCQRDDLLVEKAGGQKGIYASLIQKIKLLDVDDAAEIEAIIDLKLSKEKYKKIDIG